VAGGCRSSMRRDGERWNVLGVPAAGSYRALLASSRRYVLLSCSEEVLPLYSILS